MKRVVVITGGAGGIGQACVEKFLQEDQVIVVDANKDAISKCVNEYGVKGYYVDLLNIDSIVTLVGKIIEDFGRIDVLVQAAGVMHSTSALTVTEKQWDLTMDVNVKGMFFMMQEVVKQYMQENGGVILNFASEAGIRGYRGPMASVHYATSKGAVISMSKQLAVEWGEYNIRVNSICPGGVLTPAMQALDFDEDMSIVPMGRLSRPEEIADTIVFVCSDKAKMITGQNIIVDGGCAAVGV